MELWSAFLIGLAGSLHCAGMCGPLLLALPACSKSRLSIYTGRIIYNAGRITSYIFLGFLFGTLGSAAVLYGFQQNMSVLLGAGIVFLVILPRKNKNKISRLPVFGFYNKKLQGFIGRLLNKNSAHSLLFLGILNGLLPCGLVYVGLAGAVASAGLASGMIFMAFFGLGTLPLMFTVSLIGHYAGIGFRRNLNRIVPFLALLLGAVFILRGLDLGIPYLSPKLSMSMNGNHLKSAHIKQAGLKSEMNQPPSEDCCR